MMTQRDDKIMSVIVRRLKFLPCLQADKFASHSFMDAGGRHRALLQRRRAETEHRDRGHCYGAAGSVELHVLVASSGAPGPMGVMVIWAQVAAVHSVY